MGFGAIGIGSLVRGMKEGGGVRGKRGSTVCGSEEVVEEEDEVEVEFELELELEL